MLKNLQQRNTKMISTVKTQPEQEDTGDDSVTSCNLSDLYRYIISSLLSQRNASDRLQDGPLYFRQIVQLILRISIPRAISYSYSIQVASSSVMQTRLSPNDDALASIALSTPYSDSLIVILGSLLFALNPKISELVGEIDRLKQQEASASSIEEKYAQIALAFANGLILFIFLSLIMTPCLYYSGPILSNVFRQDATVSDYAQSFLRPYTPVGIAMLWRLLCEPILFSFRYEMPMMWLSIIGLAVGVTTSGWLGFGGLGIPSLGFFGVAVGSSLSACLIAFLLFLYVGLHPELRQINFYHILRQHNNRWKQFRGILALGLTLLLSFTASAALPIVTASIAGAIGKNEQIVWAYAMLLHYVIAVLSFAFGDQSVQEVLRYRNAEREDDAHRIAKYSIVTTLLCVAPIATVGSIIPWCIDSNAKYIPLLRNIMPIMAVAFCFESILYNIMQQLKPLGNKWPSTITASLCMIMGMAGAFIFGLGTRMGIYGVAISYMVCLITAVALLTPSWLYRTQPNQLRLNASNPTDEEQSPILEHATDGGIQSAPISSTSAHNYCSISGLWNKASDYTSSIASSAMEYLGDTSTNDRSFNF